MPEGRRVNDYYRLYSDAKLQVIGDGENFQPAIVTIDEFEYELTYRETWQSGIIPHYKYYAVRKYDG
ncbi:hypothetical protein PMPD1_1731 [Paramixta manurensis]|uniref:Uncharacterized protein n=1 Tax=Paramixta manurensis TaxID=2740817 RepID=A0A6M8UCP9_9GAMM|nr:hypothetical protein PMPD1_1731 [Erwiniaceae bacterium PD-1]